MSDSILNDFELQWRTGEEPDLDEYASRFADPALIHELVHLDLDYRLRRGEDVHVEEYLTRFPVLREDDEALIRLVIAEFRLSEHLGHEPDRKEFLNRFPQLVTQLRALLNLEVESVGDAMPETVLPTPVPPKELQQIGPYKLLQLIGEGGMGAVYMAEQDQPIRRRVALKVIKPGMDSKQVVRRFEAERQALAMMDHRNIAKVLDAGITDSGRPYFAMELVKGVSITKYCETHRVSLRDRLCLFIQICEAIQHAHHKGIIHRDIKPSNIIVCGSGSQALVKVIDFGLAKALTPENRLADGTLFTAIGQIVGTFQYMSPEQAGLNAMDIDTRSDVYSLGVLLYELLAGSTPMERERLEQLAIDSVLKAIREEEPPRPSVRLSSSDATATSVATQLQIRLPELSSKLRGDLDWIVMKSLEKDRTRRYATPSEFAADVRRFLDDDAVVARPPSLSYQLKKLITRHRNNVIVAAAMAFVLLTAFGLTLWFARYSNRISKYLSATRIRSKEHAALDRLVQGLERDDLKRAENSASEWRRRADTAQSVLKFFTEDLLKQTSPGEPPDRSLTVKALVDRGAATVEHRFRDEPRIQSEVHKTLGHIYTSLGVPKRASEHYARNLRLLKQLVNTHDHELAEARFYELLSVAELGAGDAPDGWLRGLGGQVGRLADLARLRHRQGRTAEAAELFERIYARMCKMVAMTDRIRKSDRTLSAIRFDYAYFLIDCGQVDRAAPLVEEHLRITDATFGPTDPQTLRAKWLLTIELVKRGALVRARQMAREIWETRRKVLGDSHPDTLAAAANYAMLLRNTDLNVCQHYLEHAYRLARRNLPRTSAVRTGILRNLVSIYQESKNHEKGLPAALALQRTQSSMFGEDHRATLESLRIIATFESLSGDHLQAVKKCNELIAKVDRVFGEQSSDACEARIALAGALSRQDRVAESDALFVQLIERYTDQIDGLLFSHGSLQLERDDYAESERLFLRLLNYRIEQDGEHSKKAIEARRHLSRVYASAEKSAELIQQLEEIIGSKEVLFGENNIESSMDRASLARAYKNTGDDQKARRILAVLVNRLEQQETPFLASELLMLAECQRELGELDASFRNARLAVEICHLLKLTTNGLKARQLVGTVLAQQGEFDMAHKELSVTYRGLKTISEGKEPHRWLPSSMRDVARRMIKICSSTERLAEAEKWEGILNDLEDPQSSSESMNASESTERHD